VRSAYELITDPREVPARIGELAARTVIYDVEPLVAPWDSSQDALDRGIAEVVGQAAQIRGVRAVCFATNSARRPSRLPAGRPGLQVRYVVSARKPLRVGPYADLPGPGVVVGDQIATDGILARRIGYSFLHFQPRRDSMPAGPHLLSGCGEVLRPLLFARPGRP